MPDITLPNDISADTTTVAANLEGNLYEPNSVPDTFEVVNGRLDEDNLHTSALPVPRDVVRAETFLAPVTRGANANVDVFENFFQGIDSVGGELLNDANFKPTTDALSKALTIPGAALTYYVPWDDASGIYISWHISLVVDILNAVGWIAGATPEPAALDAATYPNHAGGETLVTLFIDGVEQVSHTRRFVNGNYSMIDPLDAKVASVWGTKGNNSPRFPDHRWWNGSMVIDASSFTSSYRTKGWHTVELRVATDAKQVRFKTRRMTAIPFR